MDEAIKRKYEELDRMKTQLSAATIDSAIRTYALRIEQIEKELAEMQTLKELSHDTGGSD